MSSPRPEWRDRPSKSLITHPDAWQSAIPAAKCTLCRNSPSETYAARRPADEPDPLFSQCDLDALAYLFGPLLEGVDAAEPGPSELDSTFDCSA